jgi:hypothetical protein
MSLPVVCCYDPFRAIRWQNVNASPRHANNVGDNATGYTASTLRLHSLYRHINLSVAFRDLVKVHQIAAYITMAMSMKAPVYRPPGNTTISECPQP